MDDAFRRFFRGLARQAPGTDDDTRRALAVCDLPSDPVVWDLGAGTGASTLVLAEELDATITAIDRLEESLVSLAERAERRGLENVKTVCGDFLELDAEPGSIDLIWSEGSIYAAGWPSALRLWGDLLAPGGYLVVSDCVWTSDDPPQEAVEFWEDEYPNMATLEDRTKLAENQGFEVVETFEADRTGWLDYYGPLRQRAQLFGSSDPSDDLAEVVEMVTDEIAIFEKYGEHWNYAFFVLRR